MPINTVADNDSTVLSNPESSRDMFHAAKLAKIDRIPSTISYTMIKQAKFNALLKNLLLS